MDKTKTSKNLSFIVAISTAVVKAGSNHGIRWIGICCVAGVFILSACGPKPESALRIGTNNWPGYEPLYLARSLGEYEESSVRLIEFSNASEVIHALRSKTLEGAALTLDEALTVVEDEFDLRIILVMDYSNGGDALVAKPEISSLAELRGKRIAVEYTAVGAILLNAALDSVGMHVSDVEIIACMLDEHIKCYSSVDAVVTFEPVKTMLMNQGARLLFDSSQIPGRIIDVLVVHADTIRTHPNALRRLLIGYVNALEYLRTHPDDAAKRMVVRLGLSPGEVIASYDYISLPGLAANHRLFTGNPVPLQTTVDELLQFMLENNLISRSVATKDLLDGSFLPDIQ